jgi:hypothetical protein
MLTKADIVDAIKNWLVDMHSAHNELIANSIRLNRTIFSES